MVFGSLQVFDFLIISFFKTLAYEYGEKSLITAKAKK